MYNHFLPPLPPHPQNCLRWLPTLEAHRTSNSSLFIEVQILLLAEERRQVVLPHHSSLPRVSDLLALLHTTILLGCWGWQDDVVEQAGLTQLVNELGIHVKGSTQDGAGKVHVDGVGTGKETELRLATVDESDKLQTLIVSNLAGEGGVGEGMRGEGRRDKQVQT